MNDHEESRRQQMEENKRRMEQLGLIDSAHTFKAQVQHTRTKRIPKEGSKPVKQEGNSQTHALGTRRSARSAARALADYKHGEAATTRFMGGTAADAAVMDAMQGALTALTNPTLIMPVRNSYGVGSYGFRIPLAFREDHLPDRDVEFIVEDEDEMEWNVFFNCRVGQLNRGWHAFDTHHALNAGDCCLFELVSPLRFRVQIFRHDEHSGRKKRLVKRPKKEERKSTPSTRSPRRRMRSLRKNVNSKDERGNGDKGIEIADFSTGQHRIIICLQ